MKESFSNVFVNLDMDLTDRELMKNAEVIKISVSADRSSLTVYLRNKEEIPRSTIRSAEKAIREKIFDNKSIQI